MNGQERDRQAEDMLVVDALQDGCFNSPSLDENAKGSIGGTHCTTCTSPNVCNGLRA